MRNMIGVLLFVFITGGYLQPVCSEEIVLQNGLNGYDGCNTETYYNYDHWDKRHWFQPWLNMPSFSTNKSFARNGGTTIADVADYCC